MQPFRRGRRGQARARQGHQQTGEHGPESAKLAVAGQESGSGSARGPARRRLGASWWDQFPAPLQELALLRLIGSLGAGGVLYLTPMVFHQAALEPTDVTQGVALAALAGTAGRLLCGLLLDRGLNCGIPVLLALLFSVLGDGTLLGASHFPAYLLGQALLGLSMGFYWPAIELAVALSCPPVPSARGSPWCAPPMPPASWPVPWWARRWPGDPTCGRSTWWTWPVWG